LRGSFMSLSISSSLRASATLGGRVGYIGRGCRSAQRHTAAGATARGTSAGAAPPRQLQAHRRLRQAAHRLGSTARLPADRRRGRRRLCCGTASAIVRRGRGGRGGRCAGAAVTSTAIASAAASNCWSLADNREQSCPSTWQSSGRRCRR
jgi:hypothetical protein